MKLKHMTSLFLCKMMITFLSACVKEPEKEEDTYYTVTFETNGGTSIVAQTVKSGDNSLRPVDPKRGNDVFDDWYETTNLTGTAFNFNTPIKADITLYAKWIVGSVSTTTYKVIFNLDDETYFQEIAVDEGNSVTRPEDPVKDGHVFENWYMDEGFEILFDFDTKITETIYLYPKWVKQVKTKVFLVGDSTVSSFNDEYYLPRFGYGTKLKDYLNDDIEVVNLALSGRSSKSFLVESNYQKLMSELKEGDYLIIGFGHNDQKNEVERYTNPNLSVTDETSFKYYLYEYYIKMAQEKGATPILATPIVRRNTGNNYEGSSGHITNDQGTQYPGGNYQKAIIELAEEKLITVIDLTAITKSHYLAIGAEEAIKYHAQTGKNIATIDDTHLNEFGASFIAYSLVEALKETESTLKSFVKADIMAPVASDFGPNPNYKEGEYQSGFTPSTIWTGLPEGWFGTVFGDVGGNDKVSSEHFGIGYNENTFTLRAGDPVSGKSYGKIAGTSDGLAMVFQQVEKFSNFKLSAQIKIIDYTANNQVAFGLMVRDDIYIDQNDKAITTDYLTAGFIDTRTSNLFLGRHETVLEKKTADAQTVVEKDAVLNLSIEKQGDTYFISINGFVQEIALDLFKVDQDYLYVGLFVARSAIVEFTNVVLTQSN